MKKLLILSTLFYSFLIIAMFIVNNVYGYSIMAIAIVGLCFDLWSYRRWKKGKKVYTIRNLFK